MSKELELWQFIASRLNNGEPVMMLIVAESSGSSPGRQGNKMAVTMESELCGSIGGGMMEVSLVNDARSRIQNLKLEMGSKLVEQVHRKNNPHSSGMICSGRQTVIFKLLTPEDGEPIEAVVAALENANGSRLVISSDRIDVLPPEAGIQNPALSGTIRRPTAIDQMQCSFERSSETEFAYREKLGHENQLCIVGGGHCALALSELMYRMDFHIRIFDDRPDLNTIEKNRFANEITIIDGYDQVGELINSGRNIYVVVMTLGYRSDEIVIRTLFDKQFRYFGVLGSRAKMKTMMKTLKNDGFSPEGLAKIHTPIGLSINSRTPEEIAVSIAAEIISVKNQ